MDKFKSSLMVFYLMSLMTGMVSVGCSVSSGQPATPSSTFSQVMLPEIVQIEDATSTPAPIAQSTSIVSPTTPPSIFNPFESLVEMYQFGPGITKIDELPVGMYIVTISEDGLLVYSLDGERIGQIASGDFYEPSLSPNNSVISFIAPGGLLGFLTTDDYELSIYEPFDMLRLFPSWSSDGGRIAVSSLHATDDNTEHLGIIELERMSYVELVDLSIGASAPSWSPIDDWIAFISTHQRIDGSHDIFAIEIECADRGSDCVAGQLIKLTHDPTIDYEWPSWTPDGKKLISSCHSRIGTHGICLIGFPGGDEELLGNKMIEGDRPLWSPSGDLIAFERGTDVFVINSEGGNERKIADSEGLAFWLEVKE